jgi:hypothetical protein
MGADRLPFLWRRFGTGGNGLPRMRAIRRSSRDEVAAPPMEFRQSAAVVDSDRGKLHVRVDGI